MSGPSPVSALCNAPAEPTSAPSRGDEPGCRLGKPPAKKSGRGLHALDPHVIECIVFRLSSFSRLLLWGGMAETPLPAGPLTASHEHVVFAFRALLNYLAGNDYLKDEALFENWRW